MIRLLTLTSALALGLSLPAGAQNPEMVDEVFTELDANRNGLVSAEELRSMSGGDRSQESRIALMIIMLDVDGDGALSKEEFSVMMAGRSEISDEQARRLFDHFDTDGNGVIDVLEGRAAMAQMQSNVSEAEQEEALFRADANGDGEITYDEFRKAGQ